MKKACFILMLIVFVVTVLASVVTTLALLGAIAYAEGLVFTGFIDSIAALAWIVIFVVAFNYGND